MVKVSVKWGKQVFNDVELDTSAPVMKFKELLYTMTGVPVGRQKLMAKKAWKGVLKDDVDLSTCGVTEGHNVMLMGSSTGIPKAPVDRPVFVEDMTAVEAAKAGAVLPPGLVNLGNTCYMNSTLECLRYVPELREGLATYDPTATTAAGAGAGAGGPGSNLLPALRDLYKSLDNTTESMPPAGFWGRLQMEFPMFAERTPQGHPRQQDSEEFQSVLMTALANGLKKPVASFTTLQDGNLVDTLFGVEFETSLTCAETDDEPPSHKTERARKLVCNIEGGAGKTTQVNHMHEGITLGLQGEVEKRAETLGRNAVFKKSSLISRLPKYLCVQFMRFYWKATPDSRDHAGVKCKMLRPVTFPADAFDVYQFCTESLKAKLKPARDRALAKLEEEDKARAAAAEAEAMGGGKTDEAPAPTPAPAPTADADDDDDDDDLAAALALSMGDDASAAGAGAGVGAGEEVVPSIDEGLPADFQGIYEMFALVTHKGRSADSGHYMGWVRQEGDDWLCFDDDEVSPCKTEDVLRLKGGGDHHMASVVFYRVKK